METANGKFKDTIVYEKYIHIWVKHSCNIKA